MGMSINTLTMFGLVLVIGIVVDDAIVVVENVSRVLKRNTCRPGRRRQGDEAGGADHRNDPGELAVFVPTVIMGGITGRLVYAVRYNDFVAVIFWPLTPDDESGVMRCCFAPQRRPQSHG
jgi:HAE1 family hydrophobic/amphiphilic exporter-1